MFALTWPLEKVLVYRRSAERRRSFAGRMSERLGGTVQPMDLVDEVCSTTRVVVLATKSKGLALWWSERLEAGMVGRSQGMVSGAAAPFEAIKHPGIRREHGREGIEECVKTKYFADSAGA